MYVFYFIFKKFKVIIILIIIIGKVQRGPGGL